MHRCICLRPETRVKLAERETKAKQFDTEASPVVPDQSTNSAQSCLTSVCRWERVYSRCYDRTMHRGARTSNIITSYTHRTHAARSAQASQGRASY